ncbi:hypothetical protein AB0L75_29735 [Streptomyces sp. NPDC052101]|uniref:hypothetical protein n=1 Tax=Streptomyces sp. NPDC052101 TaxID=3155763 RepID=UPI00342C7104
MAEHVQAHRRRKGTANSLTAAKPVHAAHSGGAPIFLIKASTGADGVSARWPDRSTQ